MGATSLSDQARLQEEARAFVQDIVDEMNRRYCPVDMTHKIGFKPDFIPVDHFVWYKENYVECLARTLIEGYAGKAALVELVRIILERNFDLEERLAEATM